LTSALASALTSRSGSSAFRAALASALASVDLGYGFDEIGDEKHVSGCRNLPPGNGSPEGAIQTIAGFYVAPSGLKKSHLFNNPGRCPGLVIFRPVGAPRQRKQIRVVPHQGMLSTLDSHDLYVNPCFMNLKAILLLFTLHFIAVQYSRTQSWVNTENRWHVQINCIGNFNSFEVHAFFLQDTMSYNGKIYLQMLETLDSTFKTATPTGKWYREENGKVYISYS
jgi:hypothetical protein